MDDPIIADMKKAMGYILKNRHPGASNRAVHHGIHEIVRLRAVLNAIDALLQEVKSGDRVHLPIVLNEIENLLIHPTASSSQLNLHDRPEETNGE